MIRHTVLTDKSRVVCRTNARERIVNEIFAAYSTVHTWLADTVPFYAPTNPFKTTGPANVEKPRDALNIADKYRYL